MFPSAANFISKQKIIIDDRHAAQLITQDRSRAAENLDMITDYWKRLCDDSPKIQNITKILDRMWVSPEKARNVTYMGKHVVPPPPIKH